MAAREQGAGHGGADEAGSASEQGRGIGHGALTKRAGRMGQETPKRGMTLALRRATLAAMAKPQTAPRDTLNLRIKPEDPRL